MGLIGKFYSRAVCTLRLDTAYGPLQKIVVLVRDDELSQVEDDPRPDAALRSTSSKLTFAVMHGGPFIISRSVCGASTYNNVNEVSSGSAVVLRILPKVDSMSETDKSDPSPVTSKSCDDCKESTSKVSSVAGFARSRLPLFGLGSRLPDVAGTRRFCLLVRLLTLFISLVF